VTRRIAARYVFRRWGMAWNKEMRKPSLSRTSAFRTIRSECELLDEQELAKIAELSAFAGRDHPDEVHARRHGLAVFVGAVPRRGVIAGLRTSAASVFTFWPITLYTATSANAVFSMANFTVVEGLNGFG